ncbi:uncharacterized protein Bfra_011740 [Botrytis fragariae]|uniref:Uncharacterized protein n=1 Tax=Botrytis fragariae TaxID=1964551 RepID=A0A8H6AKB6_9HELO|nr:uncharacterized protein Bfra_011740 [Botrytis fragariae]KAF5869197.1 hypothetical protein Bfra_011740 [Botrytis fragariae]
MPNYNNRCYSLQCFPSSVYAEPAIVEYQEWPFQCFLKGTSIGNVTIYNFEFQLRYIQDCFISPLVRKKHWALVHSRLQAPRYIPRYDRQGYVLKADAFVRMKKNSCFWEESQVALPYRTQTAIQMQYSTKLKM